MEAHQILRDNFLSRLDTIADKATIEATSASLASVRSVDTKIRRNVIDFFRRMFGLLYAYVHEGRREGPKPMWIDSSLSGPAQLEDAFQSFVDDLTHRWSAKAARDERFGRDSDSHKERVKIDAAMQVRRAFQAYLDKAGESGNSR